MKNNIYIKALEIGFKNETNGISFNEIVKELGINDKLDNDNFKVNFTIWFYINFFHPTAESRALRSQTGGGALHRIAKSNIEEFDKINCKKAFIKGEATKKYIDYLELKESRQSSQTAKKISYFSIGIAIASIFLSPFISRVIPESPRQVIVTENRDKTENEAIIERLTKIDSTISSAITKLSLIANKKVETSTKKQGNPKLLKN